MRPIWSGLGGGVVVPVVAVDGEPPFLLVFLFERRAGGESVFGNKKLFFKNAVVSKLFFLCPLYHQK